ncbi:nitrous oxide reductase accessory protein NosL [Solibacillus sp. FSL W7-1436]|uniref:nitrous oxide reductase accessory protein NosL n=1 Tax=unclassified Solibacillus TaxID=2637870 RepID=UPI0030F72B46
MKLFKWIGFTISVFILAACSEQTYEPREINAEADVCYMCNMSITHVDYAAQIVLKNGDHVAFDDLGCLMEYVLEQGKEKIGAGFIRDTNSSKWLNIEEAIYVYSKEYWTPMNYGVLAFNSQEEANDYIKAQPGEIVPYEELLTFNWGVHEHE